MSLVSIPARTAALALVSLLLSALAPSSAEAYVTLRTFGGAEAKWPTSNVSWNLHPFGSDDVTFLDLKAAIEGAFGAWQAVDCSTLQFTYGGTSSSPLSGAVHIVFEEDRWDRAVGDAAAFTVSDKRADGSIRNASIVFNGVDMRWTVHQAAAAFGARGDLGGVATHEIGHAIGLDHPWPRESTMFFSGGSAELRTLHTDDERGVCYLYPAVTFDEGLACDSCRAHGDCANGVCLSFPWELASYCGQDCTTQDDCPPSFRCVTVDGQVGAQCAPMHDWCSPRGGTVPAGDYCWGPAMCMRGECVPVPGDAYCTRECTPGGANSCPTGFACLPTTSGSGVCIKEGSKGFGDECISPLECAGSVCFQGFCSQACSGAESCPGDAICVGGNCALPGPVPFGDPCQTPAECETANCGGSFSEPFCTKGCRTNAQCPPGSRCSTSRRTCSRILLGDEGDACADAAECRTGLDCMRPEAGEDGACRRICDPYEDAGCGEGGGCAWIHDAPSGQVHGGCVTAGNGGESGAPCGIGTSGCQRHLHCVIDEGASNGTCVRDCRRSDGHGCTHDEPCIEWVRATDPSQGVCDPAALPTPGPDAGPSVHTDSSAPTSDPGAPRGAGDPGANPTGSDRGTPGADRGPNAPTAADASPTRHSPDGPVVLPASTDSAGGSSSGCGTTPASPAPGALGIALLLGGLLFTKRRNRSDLRP